MAVTKKLVEEMKVAEMKMLRFAIGVTRKDKIGNEYVRGTVMVKQLRMKMREGRLRWYGHIIRRDQEYVGSGNGVTKKEEKRTPKRRFADIVKENMEKVDAREKDIENRTLWRNIIRCGYP